MLPLLLWMSLIFSLSTNSASAARTNPIVNQILLKILPGAATYLTASQIDAIDFCLRKGAHITEYTILSLLAFRAFRYGRANFKNHMAFAPLLLCILYAASDEYHQSFYSQRGSSPIDVFTDSFGVLLGAFFSLWMMCRRIESSRPSTQDGKE